MLFVPEFLLNVPSYQLEIIFYDFTVFNFENKRKSQNIVI